MIAKDCLSLQSCEKKLEPFSPDQVFTTIITFEEQMRGWLAYIAKSNVLNHQIHAYQKLHRFLETYRNTAVIDSDEPAAKVFKDLRNQKIRIGTMDLKIASIAISRGAILVSRNLRDFEGIPNLTVQDWSR